MTPPVKLFLIGAMGAGKSTIGKKVARKLNWPYFDNDGILSERTGKSIEELSQMPVAQLHELEFEQFELFMEMPAPFIAGAAGSIVDRTQCLTQLKSETFAIYLDQPLDFLERRKNSPGVGKQALTSIGRGVIAERYKRRDPLYRSVAQLIVPHELANKEKVELILKMLSL